MLSDERYAVVVGMTALVSLCGTSLVVLAVAPPQVPFLGLVPAMLAAGVAGRVCRGSPSPPVLGLAAGGIVPFAVWTLYHLGDVNGLQTVLAIGTWVGGFTSFSFLLATCTPWLARRIG